MTVFLLVRHAAHELIGKVLCGRTQNICLSGEGKKEAASLARLLGRKAIERVQSSPQRRAVETAEPLCRAGNRPLHVCAELDEVDFGSWSGLSFDELQSFDDWRSWNGARSTSLTPAGDSMAATQVRIVNHMRATAQHHSGTVVMFTHAEVIRAAVLHCLGWSLDEWPRVDIPPASITTVAFVGTGHLLLSQRLAA